MTFLFLHGVNNTPNSWMGVCNRLEAQDFVTKALFLPPRDTVEAIAREMLTCLDSGPYWVIGHSFGGMVALALAEVAIEKIAGIALVNSIAGADTDEIRAARFERIAKAEQGGYRALATAASSRAYHPQNQSRQDLQTARTSEIDQYGEGRFISHQKAMAARPDRTAFLKQLTCPKLAVIGDGDVVIPADKQRAMASECGMEFVVVDVAGHMLPMEQDEALADVLMKWAVSNQSS